MAAVPSARVAVSTTEWAEVSPGADAVYLQVVNPGEVRIVFGAAAPNEEDPEASFVVSKDDGIVQIVGVGNETKAYAKAQLKANLVAVLPIPSA